MRAPNGSTFPGGVRSEIAHLVEGMVREFHERGYHAKDGWCWGYAYRKIRGSSTAWSNHCLSGDTKVVTYDGAVPISELAGTSAMLLTRDPTGQGQRCTWVEAPIRSFGQEPTFLIRLSRGGATKEVRATAAHRWFVDRKSSEYVRGTGRSRYKVATEEKLTDELQPGDRLAAGLPRQVTRIAPSPVGIMHGMVFGDGTKQPSGGMGGPSSKVNLWGKDVELLRHFPATCPTSAIECDSGLAGIQVRGLPGFFKDAPPLFESSAYLAGWLAGYVAADGHVREAEVRLVSHDRENLLLASLVATRLGIACREPVVQKTVGFFTGEPAEAWSLGFVSATVPDWLLLRADQLEAWSEPRDGRSPTWKVESVEPAGVEEVFCASVDATGAFVLDGWLLTGNSWGLAIDFNAPDHPLGKRGTGVPAWADEIAARWGFFWGGNYSGRADEMHYEFLGTPSDVARYPLGGQEEDWMTSAEVEKLLLGINHHLVVVLPGEFAKLGGRIEALEREWGAPAGATKGQSAREELDLLRRSLRVIAEKLGVQIPA